MPTPSPPFAPVTSAARLRLLAVATLLLAATAFGVLLSPAVKSARVEGGETKDGGLRTLPRDEATAAYAKLPLLFEANAGQTDESVRFVSRGVGYNLFLTRDEAVLALRDRTKKVEEDKRVAPGAEQRLAPASYRVLRMRLDGAERAPEAAGLDEQPGKLNYFIGNDPARWRTNVPVYAKVRYRNVYRGVDLVYYGNQRQLEYDFQVAPGADPRAIKLRFEGAERARVEPEGDLVLELAGGEVRMRRPSVYQTTAGGGRQEVEGRYVVKGRNAAAFEVGEYDRARALVIDPIISYASYLGSTGGEFGYGVAVDSAGSAYMTGETSSLTFPTVGQTFVPGNSANHAFVTKVNPTGTALVYSTVIGGSAADIGYGIAVDAAGSAYVTGRTASSNFPTTANAIRGAAGLLKSTNAGGNWSPSTTGLGPLSVYSLAIDPTNNAVVYASTSGGSGVYKSTDAGATWAGLNAGFTASPSLAIDPQNPSTVYAAVNASFFGVMKTTNGGASWAQASTGLAGGFIYTLAIDPQTPTTVYAGTNGGVFKTTNGGANWASVTTGLNFFGVSSIAIDPVNPATVYASAGSGGVFKTTNGGANWATKNAGLTDTTVRSIVIDPTNTLTVYAATAGGGVFKTTNGGDNWSPVNTGLTNFSVNVIARDAGSPSTLYAGTTATGIFKTADGGGHWSQVYGGLGTPSVVALASGPASTVLAGVDLRASSFSSETEAFVTKLSPAGDALVYSTYLGGSANEEGFGIAVNSSGQAHVVGATSSADFPLVNARQATFGAGNTDAYITKLDAAGGSIIYSTYLGGGGIDGARGVAVDAAGNAYVAGQTNSTNFPVTAGAFQTTNGNPNPSFGDGDAFVAKLDPAGSTLIYSTYLGGTGNEIGYGVAADSGGNAYVAGQTNSNNFPVLNAAQPNYTGGGFSGDAFATKLNPTGTGLVYSTFIGGTNSDFARGIALVPDGTVVVAGGTESIDFNVTADTLLNSSRVTRSTDGGATWDNRNTGLTGNINQVVIDPQTPTRVYVVTSDRLFRSTDEGRTWAPHGTGLSCCLERLAIDPQNTSVMYMTKLSQPGIYKSTDGGATWSPSNGNLFFNFAKPIAIDPTATSTLYVGDFGVYKSTNGGTTWTSASGGIPGGTQINSITIDPTNTSIVYATGGSFSRLYKSTNGGGSWSLADTTLPPNTQMSKVIAAPTSPSTVYAVTTRGVYKSVDGSANWTLSFNSSNFPIDLAYDPANPSTLYLSLSLPVSGSGAFVYKSTDGGATWQPSSGPPIRIYQFAVSTASVVFGTTDAASGGGFDAFVTKLSASGSSFVYSTYLGGHTGSNDGSDTASGVAADAAGNAYVVGWTRAGDFPATPDAFQAVNRGFDEAFIAKLVESFNISGAVTNGATPQAGVRVVLTGDELRAVTTGADGTYSFVNLRPGGNYTVSALKTGFTYTPPSQTFNNLGANQTVNFSATASPTAFQTISGHIAEASGTPVPGVTVKLTGSQIDFATTDADGNYSFSVPAGGDYTVTPTALGFLFTPPAQTFNALAAGATADFTAVRQDLVVTNTNNHGAGSLRQAVTDANAIPGRDRIVFNIPGSGVKTITLLASLPDVTGPVEIDATTQPGYAGAPVVELEGFGSGSGIGLRLTGGNSVVRGLAIYRFGGGSGVALVGDNNVVEGCYLGVNAAGLGSRPNHTGLSVNGSNNRIGGTSAAARNVVSGNTFNGVSIFGASNLVKGNFIGTNPAGTSAVQNGGRGIEINSSTDPAQTANNVIGGTEDGARNIISGNGNSGIQTGSTGTVIQGNFIGTDVTGTVALGNGTGINLQGRNSIIGGSVPAARNVISGQGAGISISTFAADPQNVIRGNYIGLDAGGATALPNGTGIEVNGQNASIGGTQTGEGNVISGNLSAGIVCRLGNALIRGNLIGTDASGNLPLPNGTGVNVNTSNNVIGGTEPGARNVISGNQVGIYLGGTNNVIKGNFIGTNPAGTAPNRNSETGIQTTFGGTNNQIGGDEPGAGNLIAFNRTGVGIGGGSSAFNNLVRGNSIFSNAQLGIDINHDGAVQPNDQLDPDAGANLLQNFPVLTNVSAAGGSTHVEGTLNSTANTQFRIDFYSNAACDASGNGEGARPFGSTTVTTDAAGNAGINVNLAGTLAAGRALTATATDPANNTSEFSPCDSAAATGSIGLAESDFNVLEDIGSAPIRVVRTGGSRGALTVNYSTGPGTATAGADYTPVSGQLTFAEGETEKVIALPIADDGVTEPLEYVYLNLSGTPELEQLGPYARVAVYIYDSNTPLTLAPENPPADGYAFAEGDAGTRNNTIAVRLSAATSRTVTVSYRTLSNTAFANSDFLPVGGTLTFAPGTYRQEVQIPVIGDTIDEFFEFFTFELFDASNANILLPQVFVNILDDDPPPTISVTDVAAVEGAGAKAVFTIRLSQPSGKSATVTYSTADGTATAGSDYTAASGSVTFNQGQTVKTVEVTLLGDAVTEGDETFALNVASTNQTRATVADGQGVATIIDQGSTAASLVQFSASGYSVNEADGQVQITVTRTGNTAQAVSVDYSTVSGSASERSDFTASLGTLRFAAGETSKSFNVLVTNDRYLESAETLDLVLSNPSGVSLGGPSVVALTINSEDTADGASPVGDAAFDTTFFVRQHYHDFLNREPDSSGLAFWVNEIEQCGADAGCREVKRINVSAAFFLSIEFQETGYLVYRTYKAAYGDATSPNVPGTVPVIRLREFLPDTQRIGQNVVVGQAGWEQQLEANKNAYLLEFVSRQRFLGAFPLTLTAAEFVDKLNQNSGGVLSQSERDQLVAQLAGSPDQTQGRAAVLRSVAEDEEMRRNENNRAFVLMQYYGYLRRNPDDPQDTDFRGWKFWLDKLNEFNGNFVQAEMVKAFIQSEEYRRRFGQ